MTVSAHIHSLASFFEKDDFYNFVAGHLCQLTHTEAVFPKLCFLYLGHFDICLGRLVTGVVVDISDAV